MDSAPHQLITFDNKVFITYLFWLCVLCFKTLLLAAYRDLTLFNVVPDNHHDPHSQLATIVPPLLVEFLYVLTGPVPVVAKSVLHVTGIFRLLHTIVTIGEMPQPVRYVCRMVPLMMNAYMTAHTLMGFLITGGMLRSY